MKENKGKDSRDGIKKIADLAGVSVGTVDRVLHNRGRVSAVTKQKVQAIIQQINYKPNIFASSLASHRKRKVSILIPDPKLDAYWEQVYEGISESVTQCEQFDIFIDIYIFNSESSFTESANTILKSRPDGIIMTPIFLAEGKLFFDQCSDASIPVVMFNTNIPLTQPMCFIGTDSFQSGMVAAELLHKTAAEKGAFAILHFDEDFSNAPHMLDKERGFLAYLKKECPEREYFSITFNLCKPDRLKKTCQVSDNLCKPDRFSLTCQVFSDEEYYSGQIKSMFEKHHISGVFVSTSKAHRISSYLQKENIKGICVVGFDLVSKNIELLESGYISYLINQNPKRQAQQSITTLRNYFLYKQVADLVKFFPIEIIIKSNLSNYSFTTTT